MGEDREASGSIAPDPQGTGRPSRLTIGIFIAIVVVLILFAFLDLQAAWRTIRSGDLRWVLASLGFAAVSYVFLALSFGWVFTRMGIRIPFRTMSFIGYTSASVNHLMPLPVVTGHGIRLALLGDRGVPAGDTLAASTFHTYLTSFVLLAFFPVGLVFLTATQDLPTAAVIPILTIAGLVLAALFVMTLLVYQPQVREWIVGRVGRLIGRFTSEEKVTRVTRDFEATIRQGTRLLRDRPKTFLVAVLLDVADRTFAALALAACFFAFGEAPNGGLLLAGFSVGIVVGMQSVIPGGLGIQEASMVGIFALLGLPFHVVVLAAFLFRVTYHFVPFLVGILGYTRLMHRPFALKEVRTIGDTVEP